MKSSFQEHRNPFRDPATKPEWAQLIRLAGDHAAIRFQDLRRRISKIEGLVEELCYGGAEWGWTPRYRVGEKVLFTAHVLPGALEATIELDAPLAEKVLRDSKVADKIKQVIRGTLESTSGAWHRVRLSNSAAIRSFAEVVRKKSKFVPPRRTK